MAQKNLKNYTSEWTVDRSLSEMQQILVKRGAEKIMIDYKDGEPVGLTFALKTANGLIPVTLPARYQNVVQALYKTQRITSAQLDQAKRTAWRNLYDWVEAQLALLDTEMVKFEEIFLPYINFKGKTLYEHYNTGNLLPSGVK